jgi:sugar transferase (PEP-CTERM system associated)
MVRIFGTFIPGRSLILALLDTLILIALIAIFGFCLNIIQIGQSSLQTSNNACFLLAPVCATSIWAMGFYRQDAQLSCRSGILAAVCAAALAITFATIEIIGFRFFLNFGDLSSFRWAAIPTALCVFGVCLVRSQFTWTGQLTIFKRYILLLGDGPRAAAVETLASRTNASIAIKRRLRLSHLGMTGTNIAPSSLSPDELIREGIREVVVATEEQRGLPMQSLLQCKLGGIRVTDYLTFCERESGLVDLDALQPSWLVYSEGCKRGRCGELLKRAFDILLSIGLLTFAGPLMLIIAILIALESRGPIFYAQERVGAGDHVFTLLKFRSMRTDAEATAAPQWATKRDPRITRIGALLRPMRLDELPQLINVLWGDMSLIGPRPERPFFVDQLSREIPFYGFRHVVKPGLTGWAQINAPYAASVAETRTKLSYDLYYIKNRNFLLDLYIALSTIRVVLLREGAV